MAILSKNELIKNMQDGKLSFEPVVDQFQLQPAAIDLRAGYSFYVPKASVLRDNGRSELHPDHLDNERKNESYDCIRLKPGQTFELLPGEFVLVSTLEKINMKSGKLVAVLYPRSSTSRRGLSIEAGVVDPYYEGYLTIPVLNQTRSQKIIIYPGERIVQLVFHTMTDELSEEESLNHGAAKPKYQGSQSYQLEYKFDPQEEITMIKNGSMDKLKSEFAVDLGEKNANKGKKNKLPISS